MKLIADSGSTKTQWALVEETSGQIPMTFTTPGINPLIMSGEQLEASISKALAGIGDTGVSQVRYYGAGCIPEVCPSVADVLRRVTGANDVEVASDMLGAARALCGCHPGIVAILGTGSNSCYYDGREIVANTPPLGYVLGDEGSGARLGAMLVNGVLKGWLPKKICCKFAEQTGLDKARVIERTYRQGAPNAFLAALVPFIVENLTEESIQRMVRKEFELFFERNILQAYPEGLPVNFVGSLALVFKRQLREAALEKGLEVGRIVQRPLPLMIEFHENK